MIANPDFIKTDRTILYSVFSAQHCTIPSVQLRTYTKSTVIRTKDHNHLIAMSFYDLRIPTNLTTVPKHVNLKVHRGFIEIVNKKAIWKCLLTSSRRRSYQAESSQQLLSTVRPATTRPAVLIQKIGIKTSSFHITSHQIYLSLTDSLMLHLIIKMFEKLASNFRHVCMRDCGREEDDNRHLCVGDREAQWGVMMLVTFNISRAALQLRITNKQLPRKVENLNHFAVQGCPTQW